MQYLLEFCQPFTFFFFEVGEVDSGHLGDGVPYRTGRDLAIDFPGAPLPLQDLLVLVDLESLDLVPDGGGQLKVLAVNRIVLVALEAIDVDLELGQIGRPGGFLQPLSRAGLIDHVDRLVGKIASRDISLGELDGRLDRFVADANPVMAFKPIPQPPENLDSLSLGGRVDDDGLEPALHGAVFFYVFAVFIKGGGADALDLSA